MRTITDFLRATLYRDENARARMPADGSTDGARFEQRGETRPTGTFRSFSPSTVALWHTSDHF
jgi:hypothetical protein